MKTTAIAPANIAFIKYWGQKNAELFLPCNNSISMTLDGCMTTTTAEFAEGLQHDDIAIAFGDGDFVSIRLEDGDKNALLFAQIDRIRKMTGVDARVKVRSRNNFPTGAGIASSASGFAAFTFAISIAAGLDVSDKTNLSKLMRVGGSVSAQRSVFGGFVESVAGETHDECIARQIADEKYWDLVDLVAVADTNIKSVSSSKGHSLAQSSEFFEARLASLPERIARCRKAIEDKNFEILCECIEQDALSTHAIMMTAKPPIFYWLPATIAVMQSVMSWRNHGMPCAFTIDAGANVHVICEAKNCETVTSRLLEVAGIESIIKNKPSGGVRVCENHLF